MGIHFSGHRFDRRIAGLYRRRGRVDRDRENPVLHLSGDFCRPADWRPYRLQEGRRGLEAGETWLQSIVSPSIALLTIRFDSVWAIGVGPLQALIPPPRCVRVFY